MTDSSSPLLSQTWNLLRLCPFLRALPVAGDPTDWQATATQLLHSSDSSSWIELEWLEDDTKPEFLRMVYYANEAWASEVILCYPTIVLDSQITGFAFGLLRGTAKPLEAWLQHATHCASWQPQTLRSALLQDLSSRWALRNTTAALTWTVGCPAEGKLDSLTLSIPPKALTVLVDNLQDKRTLKEALHKFVKESFGLDLSSLPLLKFACADGGLQSSGKVKVQRKEQLDELREALQKQQPPLDSV